MAPEDSPGKKSRVRPLRAKITPPSFDVEPAEIITHPPGFIGTSRGLEVFDAYTLLERMDDRRRLDFARDHWMADGRITDISTDRRVRCITRDAAERLAETYATSQREGREISFTYLRAPRTVTLSEIAVRAQMIIGVREYHTGAYGEEAELPVPFYLEPMLATLRRGVQLGVGHVHLPGYGPFPSSAGDGLDRRAIGYYTDLMKTGSSEAGAFKDKTLGRRLTDEHLFLAPHPDGGNKMLASICELKGESGRLMAVYHPLHLVR